MPKNLFCKTRPKSVSKWKEIEPTLKDEDDKNERLMTYKDLEKKNSKSLCYVPRFPAIYKTQP